MDAGVLRKQTYQEPGIRNRIRYHLTPAGEELLIVLAALPMGGAPLPRPSGPTVLRRQRSSGLSVHIGLISDTDGHEIPPRGSRHGEHSAWLTVPLLRVLTLPITLAVRANRQIRAGTAGTATKKTKQRERATKGLRSVGWAGQAVPVRVERHLPARPAPPSPDDRHPIAEPR
ncbi:hypothetical protein ACH47Z_46070 [Streptomyces sp. NPDC020192]|uniref:hypothetical protein n=1 Tax=Streptomyces sp. NPDC020192 TaxID=3365066 RepID=UPI0037A10AEA